MPNDDLLQRIGLPDAFSLLVKAQGNLKGEKNEKSVDGDDVSFYGNCCG